MPVSKIAARSPASLMTIPLELCHKIFAYVSERPRGPDELLRRWFENREIDTILAQRAADALHDDEDGDGEGDDEDEDMTDAEDDEDEDEDLDEDEDGDGTTQTAVQIQVQTVQASPKWRHITGIMKVTHCPPPTNLLLACKALRGQAMDWYYDVAILKINATAGFAHTTFFEESLSQMASSAFSPIENVRKVEVTFVYDSDCLENNDMAIADIFEAMLDQRSRHVVKVLTQAPDLKKVDILWYDSSAKASAIVRKNEVLSHFRNLPAEIDIQESILPPGVEPDDDSMQGQQRDTFREIVTRHHAFY
jgi:hypothetical protein